MKRTCASEIRRVLIILLFICFYFTQTVQSHGTMDIPNPRGSLPRPKEFITNLIDRRAPNDYKIFFPAGDRDVKPGSGSRSQMAAASSNTWFPFEPLSPTNDWRFGVCGDLKGNPEHLKPNKFYYDGKIVQTYEEGEIIPIDISIVVHHNGFMELYLCDVTKCTEEEISETCLQTAGVCHQLERASNPECDSGNSKHCGPIDPNYRGRWYFPCSRKKELGLDYDQFGRTEDDNPTILYKLPDGVHCKHCVLQWYWASADRCNAPGIARYFENDDTKPNWGDCKGQGGAVGGYSKKLATCGKDRFTEEYLQCADIRITSTLNEEPTSSPIPTATSSASAISLSVTNTVSPSPSATVSAAVSMSSLISPSASASSSASSTVSISPMVSASFSATSSASLSPITTPSFSVVATVTSTVSPTSVPSMVPPSSKVEIETVYMIVNGERDLNSAKRSFFDITRGMEITIEAVTSADVNLVTFLIDNEIVSTSNESPFYIGGTADNPNWVYPDKYIGSLFELKVIAENTLTGEKDEFKKLLLLLMH